MSERTSTAKKCVAGAAAAGLLLSLLLPRLLRGGGEIQAASVPRTSAGVVALTFDDGPRRKTTQPLLDGLAQRGIPATFFLIGLKIPGNEDLVRRMEAEGHQVGIHAQNHNMLVSPETVGTEVIPLRNTLAGLLGHSDFMVRPPYGKTTQEVRARLGAPVILWSVDPEDWSDTDTRRQVTHIVSRVKDGDIILLHDVYPSSVETALQAVDLLRKRGFYFVTVEELFALRGVEPQEGEIYRCLPMQLSTSAVRNCCAVGRQVVPHRWATRFRSQRQQT